MAQEAQEIVKKKFTLLLFTLFAVVLAGAYFFLSSRGSDAAASDTSITVSTLSGVSAISYTANGETLSFEKKDDSWYYKDDESFPLDQTYLNSLATAVSSVTASRLVSNTSDSFPDYGLDSPTVVITVTDDTGKDIVYNIGMKNPVTSEYYFNIGGSGNVFMVSAKTMAETKALLDMAKTTLLSDTDTVDDFTLQTQSETLNFVYLESGSDTVYTDEYTNFIKNKDGSLTPADSTEVSDFVSKVTSSVKSCAAYKPEDLSQYGLDSPAAVLTMNYSDQEAGTSGACIIKIGASSPDGYYYLMAEGSNLVYTADVASVLSAKESDFLTYELCLIDLDTVDSMDIVANGVHYAVAITREEDGTQTYYVNQEKTDGTAFNTFYSYLTGIKAESRSDVPEISDSSAEVTISFYRNTTTFSDLTLKLYPYDNGFYLANFNDERRLLINKWDVETLLGYVEALG